MNALNLPGVIFRPTVFKPFYGKHQGKELHGVQIHFSDIEEAELMNLQFYFMQVHHKLYPDVDLFAQAENRWSMFDKVNGTDQIRKLFGENYLVSNIEAYLNKDVQTFREKSKAYYLYN